MRSERMVALRSTMPVGLVTLRHEVPKRINENEYQHETEHVKETTPKVDSAQRAEHVDTPVRKGGEAQW
jgi:hypothetical protein